MAIRSTSDVPSPGHGPLRASVLMLLALALLGHLYAAHAIGGSRLAYTHHVLGFLLILLVTGGVLLGLGRRYWRDRPGRTLLAIGAVQAGFAVWVAAEPFRANVGP